MRIRALKPGFFKNESLAELSTWHRLCFAGLWCCADREGRLQDRPRRLKAEIFPYDDLNMDLLLWDLARAGFIRRYVVGSQPLIAVLGFCAHQRPRPDEAASELADYVDGSDRQPESLDVTTFPALRAIDTVTTLHSDGPVTPARMGSGDLGLGSGILEGDSAVSTASSPAATRPCRAQDLVDLWNATTKPPIPRCRELTDDRRRKIRTRIARRPQLAEWREAFEAIQAGPFYCGTNDRGWIADFDWVIKNDTVIAKVLERVRTKTRAAGSSVCPHDPRCASWTACTARTIAEGRAERAASV